MFGAELQRSRAIICVRIHFVSAPRPFRVPVTKRFRSLRRQRKTQSEEELKQPRGEQTGAEGVGPTGSSPPRCSVRKIRGSWTGLPTLSGPHPSALPSAMGQPRSEHCGEPGLRWSHTGCFRHSPTSVTHHTLTHPHTHTVTHALTHTHTHKPANTLTSLRKFPG